MAILTGQKAKLANVKGKNSKNLKIKPRCGVKKRNDSKKMEQSEEFIALTQTWDEDLCE